MSGGRDRNIAVVGIGNVLMGDDAFGPYVVRSLSAHYRFPPEVELIDAGTPGHDFTLYLEGRRALVLLDAVRAQGDPGELRMHSGEEILRQASPMPVSPHEPGVREALMKLALLGGEPPEVILVGVIPGRTDGPGLSDPVRRAIPAAEAAVLAALASMGIAPQAATLEANPDIWWE